MLLFLMLVILVGDMHLKWHPNSPEALSHVPKLKKPGGSLPQKMCSLDKLASGMSSSAYPREFNLSEPAMSIKKGS